MYYTIGHFCKSALYVQYITTLILQCHTSVQFDENYTLVQFDENYTLAQFDETICFFKLMENVYLNYQHRDSFYMSTLPR